MEEKGGQRFTSAGETFVRAASICELFLASKRKKKKERDHVEID